VEGWRGGGGGKGDGEGGGGGGGGGALRGGGGEEEEGSINSVVYPIGDDLQRQAILLLVALHRL